MVERYGLGRRDGGGGVIEIQYLTRDAIDDAWPEIFSMIERACDHTLTPRDIYQALQDGGALAWVVVRDGEIIAAATTREHKRHGNVWLDVATLGGEDWHEWGPQLSSELARHAQSIGADAIVAHVRRGLAKWMKEIGWRERQVHMELRTDG